MYGHIDDRRKPGAGRQSPTIFNTHSGLSGARKPWTVLHTTKPLINQSGTTGSYANDMHENFQGQLISSVC